LLELQQLTHRVLVDTSLIDYMLTIVERTRTHESLSLGVSPRGSQALYRSAQALAVLEGRDYVIPDDIKRLATPVFGHRVVVNSRATLALRRSDLGDRIIDEILQHIDVPL
ncbi:MAG: ATPase, partial [Bryobacteraceae bacterium]